MRSGLILFVSRLKIQKRVPIEVHEDSSRGSRACHCSAGCIVKVSRSKGLAEFEKLNVELRVAEAKSFGPRLPRGLEKHREQLIDSIADNRTSNLRIGLLVASYRDHYKIEHEWTPIGLMIARSLGYKSYTSLHSLMKAAVNAVRIPHSLLVAIIELGIDPTEGKYRQLVKELLRMVFAGDIEDARVAAQAAIDVFRARREDAAVKRKSASSASAAQFGDRIARQVTLNVRSMPAEERRARAELIVRKIEESLGLDSCGWSLQLTWIKNASEMQSADAIQVAEPDAQASASRESAARAEVIPIKSEMSGPESRNASEVPPAEDASNPQTDSRGASSRHKRTVRSVNQNQLDLWFEGPASQADQPVVHKADSVA